MGRNFFERIFPRFFSDTERGSGRVAPFKAGERIVFLGDSITHNGDFIRWTQFLYCLRNPGRIFLENAGVAGGDAGGGFDRLVPDVLARKPDRVFIMFGMNDLDNSLYREGKEGEEAARLARLETYKENIRKLCDGLENAGVKAVLMTPTPYNQYGDGPKSTYNEEGLGSGAGFLKALAEEKGLEIVDLHAPFTALLKTRPEPLPIREDRVHPNPLGQLLMAYYFWKEMGLDGRLGEVTLNGATGRVERQKFAAISDFRKREGKISFRYSVERLPFIPDRENHQGIDALVPFTEEFNKEILRIKELPPGRYSLRAGKKCVGEWDAALLEKGIDLAGLKTPAFYQAEKGYQVVMQIKDIQLKMRNIVQSDLLAASVGADVRDYESACRGMDRWYEKEFHDADDPGAKYFQEVIRKYKDAKKKEKEFPALLESSVARLRRECKKVSYMIELRKI